MRHRMPPAGGSAHPHRVPRGELGIRRTIGAVNGRGFEALRLSIWGAFFRIVLPIALPGIVAAFILAMVLCWNEYFFASLLTGVDAQTLPVMVASQTGSQGINWWTMAALSTAAIAPLVLIGIFLERYIVMGLTAGSGK